MRKELDAIIIFTRSIRNSTLCLYPIRLETVLSQKVVLSCTAVNIAATILLSVTYRDNIVDNTTHCCRTMFSEV